MKPLTNEVFQESLPNLTLEHMMRGPEGYALEFPFKDRIVCVDYSRRKVKFKDANGNLISDPNMATITKRFFTSIQQKHKELCWEFGGNLNNKVFTERMELLAKLMDHSTAINKGADGESS